ncbi:R2-like ligand-binding oxidase [Paenibacillus xerothermodurans]|uniref:R2-like ligand binding oxidase n=1 Tax=Paenibacillus xerothermodurans TaxID=1977292 RepID=A0A2W1N8Q6_PAEXE|nr:R2-like ligand-binding oxidase [Paenibacillus xerothermodurans]PZE19511.1 R2-like ligand-binding oxidase [Paenibacillus xerothermodurans]
MKHEQFTTTARSLREDSLPYRLFQKAKKFGVWDPKEIDFSQDVLDWQTLSESQRQGTLRTLSQFQAGEEAVTLDLLPLVMTIAKEGRLEEELYLTSFLFEEAKHTEFFRLLLTALGVTEDLGKYHTNTYRSLFYDMLPETMNRLLVDQSPEALADASVLYNMFVEGVLAETGYWSFQQGLDKMGKMPGLMKGIGYLKSDESRHIGYGTFLLQRLICEHPHLFDRIAKRMQELEPIAAAITQEAQAGDMASPFDIPPDAARQFSMRQLQVRMDVLKRAVGKSIDEIYRTPEHMVGVIQ